MKIFIKKHRLIILAVLFFVCYRWYFTWLLFHGRSVPPEPDDSYYYLATAKKFPSLETFEDFRLAYFSAWLKLLSIFTADNLEKAYIVNFFLGPFLMLGPILLFLRQLFPKKQSLAFAVVIISLYCGSGAYHGFYWVVTSFYQLLMFFAVASIALTEKKVNFRIISLFTFLLIFSHPTSILAFSILIAYGLIIFVLDKKTFKKNISNLLGIYLTGIFSFVAYILLSMLFPAGDSPQSASVGLELIKNFMLGKQTPVSPSIISKEYFSIFFMNPITTIVYIAILVIVFKNHKKLFAIFIATLAPVILGVYMPYGSRTLAYVWPVTFVLIGYVLYWVFLKASKGQLKAMVIVVIILFGFISTVFNLIWIKSLNSAKDYEWNRKCAKQINNKTSFYQSLEAKHAFYTYADNPKNQYFLSKESVLSNANNSSVFILTNTLKPNMPHFSKIESLAANLTRKGSADLVPPSNSWTQIPSSQEETRNALKKLNLEYNSSLNCGYYEIVSLKKK